MNQCGQQSRRVIGAQSCCDDPNYINPEARQAHGQVGPGPLLVRCPSNHGDDPTDPPSSSDSDVPTVSRTSNQGGDPTHPPPGNYGDDPNYPPPPAFTYNPPPEEGNHDNHFNYSN